MNYLPYWIILAIISTSVMPSWAATVIERSGFRDYKQIVTLDEHQARIDTADRDIYTLLDLKEKKAYVVNDKEKSVVTMDIEGKPMKLPENLPPMRQKRQNSSKKDEPITAKLVKIGNSRPIEGYPTVVYQVTANGKVCSEISFSKEAANIPFFQAFLEAIHKLSSSRQPPRPKEMPIHPCRQAHDELEAQSAQLGIPMKMVIKGGKRKGEMIRHEIKKIKKNVQISSSLFALPKDYKLMTEEEMQAQQQAKFEQWRQGEQQRGKRYSQQRDRQRGDYDMPVRGREGETEAEGYYPPPPGRWREDERRGEGYYPPPGRWREDERRGEGYYPPPPGRWREDERRGEGYYPPPPGRWREDERRADGYPLPPDGWSQERRSKKRDPYYMPPPRYRDDRSGYENDYYENDY